MTGPQPVQPVMAAEPPAQPPPAASPIPAGSGPGPLASAIESGGGDLPPGRHPVRLIIPYPDKFSRLQALLYTLLIPVGALILIPQIIILMLLSIAVGFVNFIAFWAILILGRYPRGMWEFTRKFIRFQLRVQTYSSVMCTKYPPFGLSDESHPVDLRIPYPERSSRLLVLLAWLFVIPVAFINGFIAIASGIVGFLGSWAVLFIGRYPKGWFEFVRKATQQRMRISAYMMWLRNEYPPFGLDD